MSIYNNIDGSTGGANQLLDLLSVVSNPAIYEAKVKALQDATDEYNKAIALAGPAAEILDLREKAQAEKDAAVTATAEAKAEATSIVDKAKAQATTIISAAEAQAGELSAKAAEDKKAADKAQADLLVLQADIQKAQAKLDKAQVDADAKVEVAKTTLAQAKEARVEADKVKADILAKHKAFIESL